MRAPLHAMLTALLFSASLGVIACSPTEDESTAVDSGATSGDPADPANIAGSEAGEEGGGNGEPVQWPNTETGAEPSAQPTAAPTGEPTGQPTGNPAAEPSGEPTAEPSGEPAGQPAVEFDCDNLPAIPIADYATLSVTGSEDFTFDTEGYLVGVDLENNLIRTPYGGTSELVFPGAGTQGTASASGHPMIVRGIRYLADGNLVYADRGTNSLVHLDTTTFEKTTLASGIVEPNGVAVAMSGLVYVTGMEGNVVRVDPDNGTASTVYSSTYSLDGIGFAPDYGTLYFNSEKGPLFDMPMGSDGPTGEGQELVAKVGGSGGGGGPGGGGGGKGGGLDGISVDACGNIYVVQMSGTIWRVSPDGQDVEAVVTVTPSGGGSGGGPGGGPGGGGPKINAINFGSGIGGWKADAIYAIGLMANEVYEIEVGVPGAPQPHMQ